MAKKYLTTEQAAEYLGISPIRVRALCSQKVIPYYRPTNGRLLFDIEELSAFVASSRVQPLAEAQSQAAAHCINQPRSQC